MVFFYASSIFSTSIEIKRDFSKTDNKNSQNIALLNKNYTEKFFNFNRGGASKFDYSDGVLLASNTPSIDLEQINNLKKARSEKIEYTVVEGDTISSLAKLFNVSENTIKIENKIEKNSLKVNQKLTILPVSGVTYKVEKGDNIWTIADRHSTKREDILDFNEIEDANNLQIGQALLIPNGKKPKPRKTYKKSSYSTISNSNGFYIRPMPKMARITSEYGWRTIRGKKSFHGGIDYSDGINGSAIYASASGVVTTTYFKCINKGYIGNRCGGGYGNHIIIEHSNSTSTLYGHLSKINVKNGQRVKQGQVIGGMGNSGNSIGNHLHFEIINSKGQRIKPPRL